jgi:hypothetical protein
MTARAADGNAEKGLARPAIGIDFRRRRDKLSGRPPLVRRLSALESM